MAGDENGRNAQRQNPGRQVAQATAESAVVAGPILQNGAGRWHPGPGDPAGGRQETAGDPGGEKRTVAGGRIQCTRPRQAGTH